MGRLPTRRSPVQIWSPAPFRGSGSSPGTGAVAPRGTKLGSPRFKRGALSFRSVMLREQAERLERLHAAVAGSRHQNVVDREDSEKPVVIVTDREAVDVISPHD